MDISKFLSQIISATWFCHPQNLASYGSFVKALLEGSIVFTETKQPLFSFAITPTGERLLMYSGENDMQSSPASIFDNFPENSTLIIPLKGMMLKEDTYWSYGTETIASFIREAADHPNINAIIKDVHSGGGSTDSISPMIDATLYAKTKKPVLSWVDTGASAAYYSIAPDDLIIASNDITSQFGSIGVMFDFMDIAPVWKKMGVKFHTVYADESDYKNKPIEEALKGNYELLKSEILNPLARKFQSDVRKYRSGKVDITQPGILNGKMFYQDMAVKYGLADEMGNLDYAVKRAGQLATKRK